MKLNEDQILDYIERGGYLKVNIYAGAIRAVSESTHRFMVIESESTEQLMEDVKDFTGRYPGTYTFLCATRGNLSPKDCHKVYCKFDLFEDDPIPDQSGPGLPMDQVEKMVSERLKTEVQILDFKYQVKELEKKLEEKDQDPGPKTEEQKKRDLGYAILTNLGLSIIQGINGKKQGPMNGPKDTNTDTRTIEEAFKIFRDEFGDKTLINLAKKIKDKDVKTMSMIDLIKNL